MGGKDIELCAEDVNIEMEIEVAQLPIELQNLAIADPSDVELRSWWILQYRLLKDLIRNPIIKIADDEWWE